jgi:hypothetical protein
MFAIFVFQDNSDEDPRNHIFVKKQKCKNHIFVSKLLVRTIFTMFFCRQNYLEHRTADANVATVPGSIPAQWNMIKQC